MGNFVIKHKYQILLIIWGLIGLMASAGYSLEILELSKDPSHIPTCSVDTIINCLGTMKSAESYILGFPNSFLGLAMYASVFTYGFIALFLDFVPETLKKFLLGFSIFGFIFSMYLLIVGIFKLGVICPYCIASFLAGTNIFFVVFWEKYKIKNFIYYIIIWHILLSAALLFFYISK